MTTENGTIAPLQGPKTIYWLRGMRHRLDGPAYIDPEASSYEMSEGWYFENKLHRLDGPAKVYADGRAEWYKHGELHRLNGPAVDGPHLKEWYVDGLQHRLGGPAVIYAHGSKYWYVGGSVHRLDGPALECSNGAKYWYVNDKIHREEGPAVEMVGGTREWYLDGELQYSIGAFEPWEDDDGGYRTDTVLPDLSTFEIISQEIGETMSTVCYNLKVPGGIIRVDVDTFRGQETKHVNYIED